MDEVMLINLVKSYEELYNLKHRHYRNQKRRENIWDEIGHKMNESGYTCRERWTKLRENHRKALQWRRTKRGQAKLKPPKYNKELSFLVPHLQDDKNRTYSFYYNREKDDLSLDHTTEQSNVNSPLSPHSSSECKSPDYQDHSAQRTTKRELSINFDSDLETASVLNEHLKHRATNISDSDEKDPLIGFFINMGRTVRSFPIEEQIKLKNQIFLLVNNVELKLAMQSTARETEQTSILSQHPKIEDVSERTQ